MPLAGPTGHRMPAEPDELRFLGAGAGIRPVLILQPWDAHAATLMKRQAAPAPLCDLRCLVTGWRRNGASMGLPKGGLRLNFRRNASGLFLFFDEVRLGDGVSRSSYFGPSTLDVAIESDFYRTAKVLDLVLPRSTEPLEVRLEPNYRYPFRAATIGKGKPWPSLIRGRIAVPDGEGKERGLAGTTVRTAGPDPIATYETDHTGWFVLVLPPDNPEGPVGVEILPAGATKPVRTIEKAVRAGETVDLQTITLASG